MGIYRLYFDISTQLYADLRCCLRRIKYARVENYGRVGSEWRGSAT